MAKFPKMKKSEKDYEKDLGSFNWADAQSQAGISFMDSGLTEAKRVLNNARGSGLKKPYGKIGIVKKDLVFRIKYNKKDYFGEGDVVVYKNIDALMGSDKLSSKSKNEGVLSVSKLKDPVSEAWWKETLGTSWDTTGIRKPLRDYEAALEELKKLDTTPRFTQVLSTLARVEQEAKKAASNFPAKNDKVLLKRLADACAFHQKNRRKQMDKLQARLGATIRKYSDELAKLPQHFENSFDNEMQKAIKFLKDGDLKSAGAVKKRLDQLRADAKNRVSDTFLKRHLALELQKAKLHSDEVDLVQLKPVITSMRKNIAAALKKTESLDDAIDASSRLSNDPKTDKALKQIQAKLEALNKICDKLQENAGYAVDMFSDPTMSTRYGKNAWDWLKFVKAEQKNTVGPHLDKIDDLIAATRRSTDGSQKQVIAYLDKVAKDSDALRKRALRGPMNTKIIEAENARDTAKHIVKDFVDEVSKGVEKHSAVIMKKAEDAFEDAKSGKTEPSAALKTVQREKEAIGNQLDGMTKNGYRVWLHLDSLLKSPDYASNIGSYTRAKDRVAEVKSQVSEHERFLARMETGWRPR